MDCPYLPELSANEYFGQMRDTLRSRRVPLSGSMELTWRCNLRCAHCYLTAAESWPQTIRTRKELSTDEFRRVLDETSAEGCLYLLLTGGEPLVREDFWDIYLHAKRRGMLVTLFTNGTLLDEDLAHRLAEWPPRYVEISLYGHTQATYERVTGIPGSQRRCLRGIELLLEHGVPVKLKTMVMTLNQHELGAMRAYAASLGLDFRHDPMLNACVDGSSAPKALRLSPEEVVALDASDPVAWAGWRDYFATTLDQPWDREQLYRCGAGIHSFHVDPFGRLSICMMVRDEAYDLRHGSFQEGWRGHARQVRFKPAREAYACQSCPLAPACGHCPGWAQLETGVDAAPVEYLCQITHLRAQALGYVLPSVAPPFVTLGSDSRGDSKTTEVTT
jgi:radical SAM protein with 4Fe4S-binding SPASM domain